MTLALLFITLTLGVTACLALPLLRHTKTGSTHEKKDLAVYREQLAEVDNDIGRGLLTKTQAEALRAEIHRRMLNVADIAPAKERGGQRRQKIIALLIAVFLPVMALTLYSLLGSPALSGKPLADRATEWSKAGETIVFANNGAVMPEALDDFYKALKLNPADARARFYMGLAESQVNHFRKAVAIWKGVQQDSSPDAPWNTVIKDYIKVFSRKGKFDPASISPAMPSGVINFLEPVQIK